MADVTMKKGDRLPKLRMLLADANSVALDLTGAAVLFRMRSQDGGSVKVSAAAAIISPSTSGTVEYAWAVGDLDTPGLYQAEWVITWANGAQTVPAGGYVSVQVSEALG
jgi:hypothetical protein